MPNFNIAQLTSTNGFVITGSVAGDGLGTSVANAGDLNGDGYDDLIVGAPGVDGNVANVGAAFVLLGSAQRMAGSFNVSALNGANGFRLNGDPGTSNGRMGYLVSGAGDVNNDGRDDVLALAAGENAGSVFYSGTIFELDGRASFAAAYNYVRALGSNPGLNDYDRLVGPGDHGGQLGFPLVSLGDMNGDGKDEYGSISPYSLEYGSRLWASSDTNSDFLWTIQEGSVLNDNTSNGEIGKLAGVGDVNGDGYDDVLLTYSLYSGTGTGAATPVGGGTAIVYGRPGHGNDSLPTKLSQLNASNSSLFTDSSPSAPTAYNMIQNSGDFNGDGYIDLFLGAHVVFGSATGFPANMDLATVNGSNGFSITGITYSPGGPSYSAVGDINGDGYDDLVLSSSGADPNGVTDAGSVYIIYGHAGGWSATLDVNAPGTGVTRIDGSAANQGLGNSLATADINHDGYADLVIGAAGDDSAGTNAGQVYVIYGASSFDTGGNPITGTPNNDVLTGTSGIDVIGGLGGNDLIAGLGGADRIDGGDGIDTATYAASAAGVFVSLNTGQGQRGDAQGDVLTSIENLVGSAYDDVLVGNAGNNRLEGGAGSDYLYGIGGTNVLIGGLGADFLYGGSGTDTADYGNDYGAVWVDLAAGQGHWNYAEGDVLASIDNVIGTSFGDRIYGDAAANRIDGGAGDDLLSGGDGDDVLVGGLGADMLVGGGGTDLANYAGNFGAVWVDLQAGRGYWNYAEGDTLSGVENLIGTDYGDRLYGNADANRLEGGLGDDWLGGGAGADALIGGSGNDTADYTGNFGAVWVDLQAGQGHWNYAEGDTLSGIENLVGSDYGDRLYGDSGANRIDGGAGDDWIVGRGGNDMLIGGAGSDTVDYSAISTGISVDLNAGQALATGKTDTLSGIENLIGGDGVDRFFGNADANRLEGGAGDDWLAGGAGADALVGGSGTDTADYSGNFGAVWVDLAAGQGHWNFAEGDTLSGIENLVGTSYYDQFRGSTANNVFTGGQGNDLFLLDAGFGQDVITDFAGNGPNAGDAIRFSAGIFTSYEDMLAHSAQVGGNVVITAGTDTLTLRNIQLGTLHSSDFFFG